jgi:predicted glycosyltransferase
MMKQGKQNVKIFKQVTDGNRFDLVVGDETYEITLAFKKNPGLKTTPFVMIYDFVGFDAMTRSPLEMFGVYMLNRGWSKGYPQAKPPYDLGLFVGELDDVPDEKFGFLLPNRREFARARYEFLGYVFPFDPADYVEPERIRAGLGYGKEPLVVCSIGGTSIGKELLELCGQAFPLIKKAIPNLRMVLVCGPCLAAGSLTIPPEVEVRGYVPSLHAHLAASSLAIVQGGGTTTLELTALRRPFIFFPVEGHCEQEVQVAGRLARHRAGIRMSYSQTTPELLADQVVANIGKEVDYAPLRTDGARRAAELIGGLV